MVVKSLNACSPPTQLEDQQSSLLQAPTLDTSSNHGCDPVHTAAHKQVRSLKWLRAYDGAVQCDGQQSFYCNSSVELAMSRLSAKRV